MMTASSAPVTVVTHVRVHDGELDGFKAGCREFLKQAKQEEKCAFLEVAFDGLKCVTHEGYADAEGVLTHIENVRATMKQTLRLAALSRLEIYGPESELGKLREPLSAYSPSFFAVEMRHVES